MNSSGSHIKVIYEDLGQREYKEVWEYQEELFSSLLSAKLSNRELPENERKVQENRLLFVEHPHVFTIGKSGSDNNLLINSLQLRAKDASLFHTDRGGDITYHGPGQIVGYPIIDLEEFGLTLKKYIYQLEEMIIRVLNDYSIESDRIEGATGVWLDVDKPGKTRKICAIGVKASRYITMHGFAFNINTDLEYFSYINPCGYTDKGVTSLSKEIGSVVDFEEIKKKVRHKFEEVFNVKTSGL